MGADLSLAPARRRAAWLKTLLTWHWISSAVCLVGLLAFAVTGFTLNHAGQIEARPVTQHQRATLQLPAEPALEWSADELYVSLPRPGGDAWFRIALDDGALEYERTSRGAIAYLNDLHKGRHTGPAWGWFIDLFAAGCVVFAATGLWILQLHAPQRALTWPLAGLGLVVPLLLAILFIH